MSRLHKFPEQNEKVGRFNRFIDFTSGPILVIGVLIWILLYNTIGKFIPIAANVIGFLLTVIPYLLYMVRIPEDYYNKLGGERMYVLIYLTLLHNLKKVIYVKDVGGHK